MYVKLVIVLCLTLVAGSARVAAEIYETRDAEGNPVFSDTPSPDAEVVDVPETNTADTVETPPQKRAAPGSGADRATGAGAPESGRVIVIDDQADHGSDSEADWEIGKAEPREEVLDAEPRKEVMEAEPRHETSGAAERREVRQAEPRVEVE
jgi:hypothetical protein